MAALQLKAMIQVDMGQVYDHQPWPLLHQPQHIIHQKIPLFIQSARIDQCNLILPREDIRIGGHEVDLANVGYEVSSPGSPHRRRSIRWDHGRSPS